ncbi:hypothetical protein CW740_04275 [Kangiella profundi]|uniref:Uncharacterized protein n=1 Tax=Kangiella profundi TaxID=1561924 RepID=A0A2K9ATM2_9GAMM|nr:hypothetical protein [Kangiella profundi]AUD78511.1 hypothetical protein CW740_04275 [Kangiella profundi]GGF08509.1 hypothetical protein GCM10011356_22540 [Kangiella profundi]
MNNNFKIEGLNQEYYRSTIEYLRDIEFSPPIAEYPTTLKNILHWEKFSRRFYHAALMISICKEAGYDSEKFKEFSVNSLSMLRSMEHWRPQGNNFDKNNWSNGYLPGAWALLGGDIETFHAKGTEYITQLPNASHWIKRSTNHGIVILSTYLVGAKFLNQELIGLDLLREIIKGSLSDGCYPEGLSYLSFILSELIPLLRITWPNNIDWYSHIQNFLPGLEGAKTHIRLASGLTGIPRATFGDGEPGKLYKNGVLFADSLSKNGSLDNVLNQELRMDERLSPLVTNLPHLSHSTESEKVFKMHFATARTNDWMLWINGSRVHLTHNAQHDTGSFFFERKDLFVGESPGREAWKHNVPLLSDAPGFPNCIGPTPFRKRTKHGIVKKTGELSWRVTSYPDFSGCPSSIDIHIRDFYIVEGNLLVIDKVKVTGPGEPVVQFWTHNLSSVWGHQKYENRTLCKMRKGRRGWISASIIGTKEPIGFYKGFVFQGKTFAIP